MHTGKPVILKSSVVNGGVTWGQSSKKGAELFSMTTQLPSRKPCWYLFHKYPSAKGNGELNPVMIRYQHYSCKYHQCGMYNIPFPL